MADNLRLKVATYNMHGLNQGSAFVEYLCEDHDVIFLQEHWLAPFDLSRLDSICSKMICFATSAMDGKISSGCLRGRPFGGVAVLVRDAIVTNVTLVKSASRYIILQLNGLLLINVYLPCSSCDNWEDEYADCLASIINDISKLQFTHIIFGGDLNVDFMNKHTTRAHSSVASSIEDFAQSLQMKFVDNKIPPGSGCTFRVETTGAGSCVDHFAVSDSLYDKIIAVSIIDSGINLSDHCAVIMDVCVSCQHILSSGSPDSSTETQSKRQLTFRWDKGDIFSYYELTRDVLSTVQVPTHLLLGCASRPDCDYVIAVLNQYYDSIVHALYSASLSCIPQKYQGFYKYWWDEELILLKESAIHSFKLWAALGKPRNGKEYQIMRQDKLRYKLAIRSKAAASANDFSDTLNDALLNKDMDGFWKSWRSKFSKGHKSTVIDGCCGDKAIADRFASVFQSVCIPNSDVRHRELCDDFLRRFRVYDEICNEIITVEQIEVACKSLKRGKAAGLDGLTLEHVMYSHPVLFVHLKLLFNMLLSHGLVPDSFGHGIIIPLIKNVDGNKTVSDNYRGITLSPVISKLFESVLMNMFSQYLLSDSLQFGFKNNSSCSHAVFTLRTVIDHYVKSGSTVTLCALDISKAFDRVDRYALLNLLMDRHVPRNFVSIFHDWLGKCMACVRWGTVYSYFFPILAGVRQGGLLSPALFAIYMDVLLFRLRACGYGCNLLNEFFGCLLYADDIVLVTHTVSSMRAMLQVCDIFAVEYDVKFNTAKSVAMRIGPRFNVTCAPLMLDGMFLKYVDTVKYLGVVINAAKSFKCSMEHIRMRFYRVFNSIYAKTRGANSELVTVELMKSYCMPFILYATEALPLSNRTISMLDNCVSKATAKIFSLTNGDNIVSVRQLVNLPRLTEIIEKRKQKFMDRLLQFDYFTVVLNVYTANVFL